MEWNGNVGPWKLVMAIIPPTPTIYYWLNDTMKNNQQMK